MGKAVSLENNSGKGVLNTLVRWKQPQKVRINLQQTEIADSKRWKSIIDTQTINCLCSKVAVARSAKKPVKK